MSESARKFVGSIPAHYDAGLGPHLFMDYAEDIAGRAASLKPACVLEIAAGTGIVSRKLRDALPAQTKLVATDLNSPMLDIARQKFKPGESVEFKPADAMALPFGDGEFDLALCQFGVMFFPDKEKGYQEVHRVLTPGGHYLFNVWDSFDYNPCGRLANRVVDSFFDTDPPSFYNTPYGYHQIDPIKKSLIDAGFTDIAVHVLARQKAINSARLFAEGLVLGNPSYLAVTERAKAAPGVIVDAMTRELQAAFGQDPGKFSLQSILFSARKR